MGFLANKIAKTVANCKTACKDLQNIRYVGVFVQVEFDCMYGTL